MIETVVKHLYLLDGGTLNVDASLLVPGHRAGERMDVPIQSYLLDTDLGYVLIDTGNDPEVITDPVGALGRELAKRIEPTMTREHHPYEQLRLLGIEPEEIRLVIYTHLHHDHCGGAHSFSHAPQIVQRSEFRYATEPDPYMSGLYVDSEFYGEGVDWRLIDGDVALLPGVSLMGTPGHSPGHQSVILWNVPQLGTVILAGDAIDTRENVRLGIPPGISTDSSAAMASMCRLLALAEAHNAAVIPSHDPEAWNEYPKCPEAFHSGHFPSRHFWPLTSRSGGSSIESRISRLDL